MNGWQQFEMEERVVLSVVVEVTLSKLGEELPSPKAEVLRTDRQLGPVLSNTVTGEQVGRGWEARQLEPMADRCQPADQLWQSGRHPAAHGRLMPTPIGRSTLHYEKWGSFPSFPVTQSTTRKFRQKD